MRVQFSRIVKVKHKGQVLGRWRTSLGPAVIERSEMKEEAQLIFLGPIEKGLALQTAKQV